MDFIKEVETKIRCSTIGCENFLEIHLEEKGRSIPQISLWCKDCGEIPNCEIKPIRTKHLGETKLVSLGKNGPGDCKICGKKAFFFINYDKRPVKFVGKTPCCYSLECYIAYLQKLKRESGKKD